MNMSNVMLLQRKRTWVEKRSIMRPLSPQVTISLPMTFWCILLQLIICKQHINDG
jgi:hypothetical protein